MIELRKGRFELNLNQLHVVSLTGCLKGSISMYLNDKNTHLEQKQKGIAVGNIEVRNGCQDVRSVDCDNKAEV